MSNVQSPANFTVLNERYYERLTRKLYDDMKHNSDMFQNPKKREFNKKKRL